jgi:hypothetical protein
LRYFFIIIIFSAFMVDKDMKLVAAIESIYNGAHVSVLLCWFHVLQVSQPDGQCWMVILSPSECPQMASLLQRWRVWWSCWLGDENQDYLCSAWDEKKSNSW